MEERTSTCICSESLEGFGSKVLHADTFAVIAKLIANKYHMNMHMHINIPIHGHVHVFLECYLD